MDAATSRAAFVPGCGLPGVIAAPGGGVCARRSVFCVAAPGTDASSRAPASMPGMTPPDGGAPLRPSRPAPRFSPRPDSRSDSGRPARPQRPPPPPGATLYTECGRCSAVYELSAEALGPSGRKVRCSVCTNMWFQRGDSLRVLRDGLSFKNYPLEKKDEMMAARAERFSGRGDRRGPSRYGDNARGDAPRGRFDRDDDRPRQPRRDSEGGDGGRYSGRSDSAPSRGPPRGERAGSGEHTLFIGNIPFGVSSDDLRTVLETCGGIERVSLVTDPDGRSKGFGFADMKSHEFVNKAVDTLDGYEMNGRHLTVRVGRKRAR